VRKPASLSFLRRPLNNLLGTQANVRSLRELAATSPLSTVQLARATKLNLSGIRRTLDNLQATGILKSFPGRDRFYALNLEHPIAAALLALFDSERAWWDSIRSTLEESIRNDKRIAAAYVYGSVARGEDRPGSDIDLVLITHEDPSPVLNQYRERLQVSQEKLGFNLSLVANTLAEVKKKRRNGDVWWANVTRDALPLKGVRPEHLAGK
jgi:predicted nucleotidyltransferase